MLRASLPLKSLALMCRSLSTLLDSGVAADKAFRIAGEKSGSAVIRQTSAEIIDEIKRGNDIATSLEEQQVYPGLMVSMVHVAEQTGTLPEILRGLADHYDNLLRLRKDFYRSIAWPIIQLVLAVFVIAGLIFLLGWIAESNQGEPIDVLGWGLTGTSGALTWLGLVFGGAFSVFLIYRLVQASLWGQQYLDSLLLRVPILGNCLRSFAIARFAWSYHLTQEAGMAVDDSIETATRATNNGAFVAAAPRINYDIQSGETVTEALRHTDLFPSDVIEMIHVGETSGTVPETLERLGPHFEDQARRSLETLAGMLGWAVWLAVAIFIIFVVFSIMMWYIGIINDALSGV